jgi:hypothetical protein
MVDIKQHSNGLKGSFSLLQQIWVKASVHNIPIEISAA